MRHAAIALVLACSGKSAEQSAKPGELTWVTDEAQAFERARREHKGVLVDFYASWAVPSLEADRRLKANAATIEATFVPLRIDVSDETDAVSQIRDRYKVKSIPSIVFVSTDGTELGRFQTVPSEGELESVLAKASGGR